MREIALDTETTGLSAYDGDKIVEIGCVEMINHIATGETFHVYINPLRDVPEKAVEIHGLDNEFLKDKPTFPDILDDFLKFIGDDAKLIIHNASFDMGFLNSEISACGKDPISMDRAVDTLLMARRMFPGDRANLDSLCKKFGINNSHRTKHGALLDAELLAEVYLELVGGREPGLKIAQQETKVDEVIKKVEKTKKFYEARFFPASDEEIKNHRTFMENIKNPVWNKIE